jgi:hypothetical protein
MNLQLQVYQIPNIKGGKRESSAESIRKETHPSIITSENNSSALIHKLENQKYYFSTLDTEFFKFLSSGLNNST